MNGFSTVLGSLRTAGWRAGWARKGGATRHAKGPLHRRNLRVESLEERTLLSVGGTGNDDKFSSWLSDSTLAE
jgi:hypothetical protein